MSAKVAPAPELNIHPNYIDKTSAELNAKRLKDINQRARYASFGSNEEQIPKEATNRYFRYLRMLDPNDPNDRNELRLQQNVLKNPTNPQRRNAARTAKSVYGNDAYKRLLNTIPPPKKKSWWSSRKTRRNKKRSTRKRK